MWDSEKKAVLETAIRMSDKGLVEGTAGNISVRLAGTDGNLMAITPSSMPYEYLIPDDMIIVDFNGKIIEGKHRPSTETPLHIAIYLARENVNAIVHAHPVYCSTAAVAGLDIPPILDEQVIYLGNCINTACHALPGSPELAQNVVSALGENNAVIMANHGALAVGINLQQAFANCEIMEKAARVFYYSKLLGKTNLIPPVALEKEIQLFRMNRDK
jgi:L-fuculose-phosphate aldolase